MPPPRGHDVFGLCVWGDVRMWLICVHGGFSGSSSELQTDCQCAEAGAAVRRRGDSLSMSFVQWSSENLRLSRRPSHGVHGTHL